jgi:DNA-binding transcriptional LysR family regulator
VLVKRTANGARLTNAGEVLVRHAEAICAALDDAENQLRAVMRLAAGGSAWRRSPPPPPASCHWRSRDIHPAVELVVEII